MHKRSISLLLPAALLILLLSVFFALRTAAMEPVDRSTKTAAGIPPASAKVAQADEAPLIGLAVTATVGLDPDACAETEVIRVAPGTRVFYCYRAVNTGQVPLTTHTLEDSQSGIIWDRQPFELAPGASLTTMDAGLTLSSPAERSGRTDVTWTAGAVTPTLTASATAVARVNVMIASVAITKTAGTRASGCAAETEAVIPAGEDAHFCLVVANTGNVPLVRHTLADPALELDGTFAYTLAPAEQLTFTTGSLAELGIDSALARSNVTQTFTNTALYTATTPPDFAATGSATVSGIATATVSLAQARAGLTTTVGTDPAVCSNATSLSISDPNTPLYYCAVLRNTGNVTVTRHELAQPRLNLVTVFTRPVAPGAVLSVTNTLLEELGQAPALGPFTVYNGANLTLDNAMRYTGTVSLPVGEEGETRTYTATASASAFAGVQSTPSPTPTPTRTSRPPDSRPTDTPWPAATPTWTPASPLETPGFAEAQQFPTDTPTPTRSFAISLLETPTSPFVSPLEPPVDAAATQEALATIAALDATATAVAASPLDTPTETPVFAPATSTISPTAEVMVIVVTATPDTALAQRPIELPTPTATPDYLLVAARTVDTFMLTATWIWFLAGSLVFFVVAGVLAGLSFRQNERQRYDLLNDGLWIDDDFLLPPPPPPRDEDVDNWPDSLP
jgi:hypothetical protein